MLKKLSPILLLALLASCSSEVTGVNPHGPGGDYYYGQLASRSGVITTDNGNSWKPVGDGSFQGGSLAVCGERLISASQNSIFASDDSGQSWRLLFTTDPTSLISRVAFIDALPGEYGYGFGVALTNQTCYLTSDAGATWQRRDFGDGRDTASLYTIQMVSQDTIVVGGAYGRLLITTNRGTDWYTGQELGTLSIDGIVFEQSDGFISNYYGHTFRSSDMGVTWSEGPTMTGQHRNLFRYKDVIFALGDGLSRSMDLGKSWRTVLQRDFYADLAFKDELNGIVVGQNISTSGSEIRTTTDGGLTWALPSSSFETIAIPWRIVYVRRYDRE